MKFSLYIIPFALFLFAQEAFGQTVYIDTSVKPKTIRAIREKRPKPITKEWSIGAKIATDGWGFLYEKGWVRNAQGRNAEKFYDTRVVFAEFIEHKHSKEVKLQNRNGTPSAAPRPYKYGKINNFYALKLGYGFRKMIAGKPDPGTVSIHWVYAGGLSVGLLKPYFIQATSSNDPVSYQKSPDEFLKQDAIVGRASLFEGLRDTKIVPGIHAKTALHFDFAAFARSKMAIETGVNAELYTQKMPIMAEIKAFPYVFNAYISLQFGKRK